jgi:hypothetical protein
MSKVDDVARRFHSWMVRYNHHGDTPSESFKSFIFYDRCIVEYGVSYEEYREVAERVKSMGHAVDWVVAKETFDLLVEESKGRFFVHRFLAKEMAESSNKQEENPQPDKLYRPLPTPTLPEAEFPEDLKVYLNELEQWALANKRDASQETLAFWMLKLPAVLASASAGIWAYFELPTVSVVFGAIASVCVIIDGLHPRGMLRNTHLRAYHDIRMLANKVMNDWRSRSPIAKPDNACRRIIKDSEEERQRIASYIRDAETALKEKSGD